MKREEIKRDYFTLSIVPQACSSLEAMEKGKQVHYHIIKSRFDSDIFVGGTLLDMCSKPPIEQHVPPHINKPFLLYLITICQVLKTYPVTVLQILFLIFKCNLLGAKSLKLYGVLQSLFLIFNCNVSVAKNISTSFYEAFVLSITAICQVLKIYPVLKSLFLIFNRNPLGATNISSYSLTKSISYL